MSIGEGVSARHSSETAEHYTPKHIVEAARATLGTIDLDPFSCDKANETVKARVIFRGNRQEGPFPCCDGFSTPWAGRVFVNPPGGKGSNNESNQKRAWFKLAAEHDAGHVSAAIFVCFSVELLQTTQSKTPHGARIPLDFPICYPNKRIAYVKEDGAIGGSPPHSSCLIYLPPPSSRPMFHRDGVSSFLLHFGPIGRVVVPCNGNG